MEWIDILNLSTSDLIYQVNYRCYGRRFRVPLKTRYGLWQVRQGIVVRLVDGKGRVGFGEVAPLPWFGSETLDQAIAQCAAVRERSHQGITVADLLTIPDTHPACQFGLEAAVVNLLSPAGRLPEPDCCHLLPTGAIALQSWQTAWQQGFRVFKWKIGVATPPEEMALVQQLLDSLPPAAAVRLDANGGLDWDTACRWLDWCDRLSSPSRARIEFIEQPLPPASLPQLIALSQQFKTAIALDESVTTLTQLKDCYYQGWRGIVVIKAAIAGSPHRLAAFCRNQQLDVVWSSVFETAIARRFVWDHLIPILSPPYRTIGYGTEQWFPSSSLAHAPPPIIWHDLKPLLP